VLAVCGVKNVGKTTFLEGLIPVLRSRGLKVGVIKRDGHDFEPDVPGTDSFRLRQAGAEGVAVFSAYRYLVTRLAEVGVEEMARHFMDCQLILLEGGKHSPYPKIEILRQGISQGVVSSPPRLAFCGDIQFDVTGAPWLSLTDFEGVADLTQKYTRCCGR
jgi:molybdopterin-guanine dinucleotide biosynthesis protein MobB